MGLRKFAYALCKLLNYCKYVAFVFAHLAFGNVLPNVRYSETRINQSSSRGKCYVPHVEIARTYYS